MKRREFLDGRPNWEQLIIDEGLTYSLDGPEDTEHYWNEYAAYQFSADEVRNLKSQVEELHRLCRDATHYLASGAMGSLGLTEQAFELARRSLIYSEPDFYGRFDLVYSGVPGSSVKLLEYNADTPTGIIEAAVSQKTWFAESGFADLGFWDWNSLGDDFVARWESLRQLAGHPVLHLATVNEEIDPSGEDRANVFLLAHAAELAGWETRMINVENILWDEQQQRWEDASGEVIRNLFKLYPWEDMTVDSLDGYDRLLFEHYGNIDHWFEPAWKMFLSNKVLLAALWKLNPGHPNLVPAYLGQDGGMRNWVRKPIFGREGEGITIYAPDYGIFLENEDSFFADDKPERFVYQEYIEIPDFPGKDHAHNHPVLGAWVVDGKASTLGIRESDGPVTDYWCRFVPHIVSP